jgi:hypothetical protein
MSRVMVRYKVKPESAGRCAEPAGLSELHEVGSFRLWR